MIYSILYFYLAFPLGAAAAEPGGPHKPDPAPNISNYEQLDEIAAQYPNIDQHAGNALFDALYEHGVMGFNDSAAQKKFWRKVMIPLMHLARPFDINARYESPDIDKSGMRLLDMAIRFNQQRIFRYLLSYGANPDLPDPKGDFPIHNIAAAPPYSYSDRDLWSLWLKLLWKYGADFTVRDSQGASIAEMLIDRAVWRANFSERKARAHKEASAHEKGKEMAQTALAMEAAAEGGENVLPPPFSATASTEAAAKGLAKEYADEFAVLKIIRLRGINYFEDEELKRILAKAIEGRMPKVTLEIIRFAGKDNFTVSEREQIIEQARKSGIRKIEPQLEALLGEESPPSWAQRCKFYFLGKK